MTPRLFNHHLEREEVKRRAEADFLGLYLDHGGRQRGKALHCLFHPDSRPSASIHGARFHCFTCNLSLDVFDFVGKAMRMDFKESLNYLADRYGVPMSSRIFTTAEKLEYARRRSAAEREAVRLLIWRNNMLIGLRRDRDWRLQAYHRAKSLLIMHGFDRAMSEVWADMYELYEAEYQTFDARIATIEDALFAALVPLFRVWNPLGAA